jgi:hypothetical protein
MYLISHSKRVDKLSGFTQFFSIMPLRSDIIGKKANDISSFPDITRKSM